MLGKKDYVVVVVSAMESGLRCSGIPFRYCNLVEAQAMHTVQVLQFGSRLLKNIALNLNTVSRKLN